MPPDPSPPPALVFYPAPMLSRAAPSQGPIGGGTLVTLQGQNFQPGATARFGDALAASVTFVGAESPAGGGAASAAWDGRLMVVMVTNPDGQRTSATLFRYLATQLAFAPGAPVAANGAPIDLTAVGFDRAGRIDLAVANNTGDTVTLLAGDGRGGFVARPAVAAGPSPAVIAAGAGGGFDEDGRQDYAVATSVTIRSRLCSTPRIETPTMQITRRPH